MRKSIGLELGRLALGGVALALSSCTVGSDYEAPAVELGARFANAPAEGEDAASLARWWERFGDPTLDDLVRRALAGNPGLQVARERIREARALVGAAGADRAPAVDAIASAERRRTSENVGSTFAGSAPDGTSSAPASSGASGSAASAPVRRNLFVAGFDASWELDLFGRVAREVEAAERAVEAEWFAFHGAQVSLLGELATAYVELRAAQRRAELVNESVASQRETLSIADARFEAGLQSELDVVRARGLLVQTEARLPPLDLEARRAIHRIAVLVGDTPSRIEAELLEPAPLPAAPDRIAVRIPADLLRLRPDLLEAERRVAEAHARVAAAEGERYPRLVLNGSFTYESAHTGDWFERPSHAWSIGPSISVPLLDGGRIERNVEASEARLSRAMATLEDRALRAVEEVENAFVGFAREHERAERLEGAVAHSARALDLADDLFEAGRSDFLDVLDSRRQWIDDRDGLVQSRRAALVQLVALYKAFGGGWEGDPLEPAPSLPVPPAP